MFVWFCATLGIAFGSAIVPVFNIEVFVLGLVTSRPELHWSVIAAAVAIGQILGKLPYYLAARGSIRLPEWMNKRVHQRRPAETGGRWREHTAWLHSKIEALRARCHRHPAWMTGTYGVSAIVGMPPFMATTVLAGLAGMSLSVFLTAGLAGRFIRYAILCAFPMIFASWFHHH